MGSISSLGSCGGEASQAASTVWPRGVIAYRILVRWPICSAVADARPSATSRLGSSYSTGIDLTARVPDSPAWTVRDAFAHVVTVVPRYAAGPEGMGRWMPDASDLPALNETELEQVRQIDVEKLAARMHTDVAALAMQTATATGNPRLAFTADRRSLRTSPWGCCWASSSSMDATLLGQSAGRGGLLARKRSWSLPANPDPAGVRQSRSD
jgi:hypothetical protein